MTGVRKHLKRINAPSSWRLEKTGGKYATKPISGPHRLRECIPLGVLITRNMQIASTTKELKYVLRNRMVRVNGVVRMRRKFPVGIMDVVTVVPTNESWRLLYNTSRKFVLVPVTSEQSCFRYSRVVRKAVLRGGVPHIYTQDGSTFRFCDPRINIGDVVRIDTATNKVDGFLPLVVDSVVFVVRGKNTGCIGTLAKIEKHMGGHNIAHVIDPRGREFATRLENVFVVGDKSSIVTPLPEGDGVKVSELEKSNSVYGCIEELAVS